MIKSFAILSEHHLKNNIGGAEVQADLLAQYLTKNGVKVTYLSSDIESATKYKDYNLLPLPRKKRDILPLLTEIDADVYYQRGRKKLTGITAEFCKKSNKKFVFASSMDIDCIRFKQFLRGRNGQDLGYLVKNSKKNLRDVLYDVYSLWGMRRADLVLSQTNFQKEALKKNLGIESRLFYNVHPTPKKSTEVLTNTTPVVLWLANIKSWKQPELFLKMATDLSELDIQFLMVGKIKNDKYIEKIKEAEKTNHKFRYLGLKTLDESNDLIANADLFINTSKNQEGFPNTFIQAWFRGVPVISLQFDPDDIIQNHELGFVAGNYKNLVEIVTNLVVNREKMDEIATNSISFAQANFSIESKIRHFINLISE